MQTPFESHPVTPPAPVAARGASAWAEGCANALREVKTQFLASLNHEIRTPLSGILGMTDLLLETRLDEEQTDYVRTTRMCAQNLLSILNAALELSALASGTLRPDEAEFALRECLEGAVAEQHEKAKAKGLAIACRLDEDLPDIVIGDAIRIRQLLSHLLDNAIKFTHEGEVNLSVTSQALAAGRIRLCLVVRDSGVGISEDLLPHIFEAFRQGQSGLSRRYSGLGLGLALAQSITHLLGGEIGALSEPGFGSAFTVTLPLRRAEVATIRIKASSKARGARILLAEDDAVAQHIVRSMLTREGYSIRCVASGIEALEATAQEHFQLILMDLQMPGMDGLEATTRVRALPGYAEVPVLAFTASSSDEFRTLCRGHGMQGFLLKPVDAKELLAAIARCLNSRGMGWLAGD